MKITKSKLKQIIKEELNNVMKEGFNWGERWGKKKKPVDWDKGMAGMFGAEAPKPHVPFTTEEVIKEWMKENPGWIKKWETIKEKDKRGYENPTAEEWADAPMIDVGITVYGPLAPNQPDGDEIYWADTRAQTK